MSDTLPISPRVKPSLIGVLQVLHLPADKAIEEGLRLNGIRTDDAGIIQGMGKGSDTDTLTPENFVQNPLDGRSTPEYYHRRVGQIIALIQTVLDPFMMGQEGKVCGIGREGRQSEWRPIVTITLGLEDITVVAEECGRTFHLCKIVWTDEDLARARKEMEEEMTFFPAWVTRVQRHEYKKSS